MTRAFLDNAWLTRAPLVECGDIMATFMARNKMQFTRTDTSGGAIYNCWQGSQAKTRLVGGWFVNLEALPKKAEVRLMAVPNGTQVFAHIEEDLGMGLLDPHFQARYEDYFRRWHQELLTAFPPVPGGVLMPGGMQPMPGGIPAPAAVAPVAVTAGASQPPALPGMPPVPGAAAVPPAASSTPAVTAAGTIPGTPPEVPAADVAAAEPPLPVCTACGKTLRPGARFCAYCGTKLF